MNRYEISLDLNKSGDRKLFRPVVLRQGDSDGSEILATITDHGKPIDTGGLTPLLVAKSVSGGYYRQSGEWLGGKALVHVDESHFAAEVGRSEAYFELRDNVRLIATTFGFPLVTLPNATGDGTLVEPYDSEIEEALAAMHEGIQAMNDALEAFEHAASIVTNDEVDELFNG